MECLDDHQSHGKVPTIKLITTKLFARLGIETIAIEILNEVMCPVPVRDTDRIETPACMRDMGADEIGRVVRTLIFDGVHATLHQLFLANDFPILPG